MLQLSCVYIESRIGKVPGSRARKRRVQQSSQAAETGAVPARTTSSSSTITTTASSSSSTFVSDRSHASSQCMAALSTAGSDVDLSLGTARDLNLGSHEPSSTDLFLPPMDFDMEEMLHYPTGGSAEFDFLSPPWDESTENDTKRLAELDSQCVLVCCQVATELESCKVANVKSLQIVLGIVKKAIEQLADLVRLQQESRSFKSMAMFGVLSYQIIELLESGCACFLDEPKQNTFASQVHGMLPGLSFGYLNMGPKEQSSWRCHIVLREIRQTSEVLQRIKKLSGVGESGADQGARAQSERERCFFDLENRLKALSDKVTSHD
jgi:hypothetical protein